MQRVDGQPIVLVDLGLDPPQPQHVQPVGADELPSLDAESPPDRAQVAEQGLQEGVALLQVNAEQPYQPQRLLPAGLPLVDRHDHEDDLGGIVQRGLVERGILVVGMLEGSEELAADHALQERIVGPVAQILEVRGDERAEIDPSAASDDVVRLVAGHEPARAVRRLIARSARRPSQTSQSRARAVRRGDVHSPASRSYWRPPRPGDFPGVARQTPNRW